MFLEFIQLAEVMDDVSEGQCFKLGSVGAKLNMWLEVRNYICSTNPRDS